MNPAMEGNMVTDTIKAALWEELRFVKRQQWTISAAEPCNIRALMSPQRCAQRAHFIG